MRLINVHTLELHEFIGMPPPYAILSHRWSTEEVTFQSFQQGTASGPGYEKIKDFCSVVLRDSDLDLDWAWVDTCCIDKSSSAELSEAINSMWKWYKESRWCAAFLPDIHVEDREWPGLFRSRHPAVVEAHKSDWFSRGWTLQELLAPRDVHFYSSEWFYLDSKLKCTGGEREWPKSKIGLNLHRVTGIDVQYLRGERPVHWASIAQRMSWAAMRETARPEDQAYCLFGIFDVSLPLLYGEGAAAAFRRLQEQLLRDSSDESIFAFRGPSTSALASSPSLFAGCGNVERVQPLCPKSYSVAHHTLTLQCPAMEIGATLRRTRPNSMTVRRDWSVRKWSRREFIVQLNCVEVDRKERTYTTQLLGLRETGERVEYTRQPGLAQEAQNLSRAEVAERIQAGDWVRVQQMEFRIPLLPLSWQQGHALPYLREHDSPDRPYFGGILKYSALWMDELDERRRLMSHNPLRLPSKALDPVTETE